MNVEIGGGHAIPFLGIHKWNFRCSVAEDPFLIEKVS
jgi:hypothetical protein